jgi:hypothetical protein
MPEIVGEGEDVVGEWDAEMNIERIQFLGHTTNLLLCRACSMRKIGVRNPQSYQFSFSPFNTVDTK